MREGYTVPEMLRRTGMAESSLLRLMEMAQVTPLGKAEGSKARLYAEGVAFGAEVVANLLKLGTTGKVQAKALRFCWKADLQGLFARGERYLVTSNAGDDLWLASEESVYTMKRSGAALIVVDLEAAYAQFQAVVSGKRGVADGRDAVPGSDAHTGDSRASRPAAQKAARA